MIRDIVRENEPASAIHKFLKSKVKNQKIGRIIIMKNIINRLRKEESGQGMVEYGLIIAGIAIVVAAAIWVLGPTIANLFTSVTTGISNGF